MNNYFKFVAGFSVLFMVAFASFYMWASSPNHTNKEYLQLIENDFPSKVDDDSTYSIISYNIGFLSGMSNNSEELKPKSFFDNNLKKVYSELELIDSDIICFQEIDYNSSRSFHTNQQEELQKIGYNYVFQAVNWDLKYLPFPGYTVSTQYGETYSGQSIFSKYKIRDPQRLVLERVESNSFLRDAFYLDRLAQVSKIELDSQEIILINVHLEAFDSITRKMQTEHIANIYKEYKDRLPTLLVGDFNSDLADPNSTINIILNIPDVACGSLGNNAPKTFPSSNPVERLDYIFYNKEFIELKKSRVLNTFDQASDHLPIYMEFKLLK